MFHSKNIERTKYLVNVYKSKHKNRCVSEFIYCSNWSQKQKSHHLFKKLHQKKYSSNTPNLNTKMSQSKDPVVDQIKCVLSQYKSLKKENVELSKKLEHASIVNGCLDQLIQLFLDSLKKSEISKRNTSYSLLVNEIERLNILRKENRELTENSEENKTIDYVEKYNSFLKKKNAQLKKTKTPAQPFSLEVLYPQPEDSKNSGSNEIKKYMDYCCSNEKDESDEFNQDMIFLLGKLDECDQDEQKKSLIDDANNGKVLENSDKHIRFLIEKIDQMNK